MTIAPKPNFVPPVLRPVRTGSFGAEVFGQSFLARSGGETHDGIEVHESSGGPYHEAGRARNAGRRNLPQGRYRPSDLFQLQEKYGRFPPDEMRRPNALRDESARLKKIVAVSTVASSSYHLAFP